SRAGFAPTMVESAPTLRTGGYIVDFWGPGFEAAERMGLAPRLREIGYRVGELRLLNARGAATVKLDTGAVNRLLGERYVSLPRGELAAAFFNLAKDRAEARFDEEIERLVEDEGGVDVTFRRGPSQRFDLVFGADGLHSKVRRLAFGEGPDPIAPLGYHVAAFTAPNYPHRDELAYVTRTVPGRQAVRFALRDGSTAFFMMMRAELARGRPLDTSERQRAYLAETFAGVGVEAPDLVWAMEGATDLYFDIVAQVRAPAWSNGRVALVGDAAWCPSLLAGEGAAFATAGALVLAGELADAQGDHRVAFPRYERRLRAFIEKRQKSVLWMGAWFAPKTRLGLFVRDRITALAALPGLDRLLLGPTVGGGFALPDYPWTR
ncbi:MAG: FAD-dependent monooxygenase, partial [Caulobacteraceae bacterium]